MKSLKEITATFAQQREGFKTQQGAKFDTEFAAANDFFERTGRRFHNLSPTQQRRVIEKYLEDQSER